MLSDLHSGTEKRKRYGAALLKSEDREAGDARQGIGESESFESVSGDIARLKQAPVSLR